MKMFKQLLVLFGIWVFIPILFIRCSALIDDFNNVKSSLDSINMVSNPELTSGVHLVFIDSKTNEQVSPVVTISGKNADKIYNNLGEKLSSYETVKGMIDLMVDPHVIDTNKIESEPIVFNVTANLSGYGSVTQKIVINSSVLKDVVIPMINLSSPPEGVSVSVVDNFVTTGSDGKTKQKATIQMNSGSQVVEIPAGTLLKDVNGAPLTGQIKAQVIYYNPTSNEAQNNIPGGTNVTAQMPGGSSGQIQFISAGMFTINLTSGDKSVKSFENGGLKIKSSIPDSIINPKTKEKIKNGDVIEMWSKEDGSDEWKFEKMDTIRTESGKLTLEETVTHLSSWNWDFYYYTCYVGPRIVFTGNTSSYASLRITTAATSRWWWYGYNSYYRYIYPASYYYSRYYNNFQMYYTPSNMPQTITITSTDGRHIVSPSTINTSGGCGGTYYVTVTEKVQESIIVNANFSVRPTSKSNLVLRPNVYIYIYPTNYSYYYNYQSTYLRNGSTTLRLLTNTEYMIFAYYGTKYGYAKLRIDKEGTSKLKVTLTPSVVYVSGKTASVFNSVSYIVDRPSNNIISVNYNFQIPDNIFSKLQ